MFGKKIEKLTIGVPVYSAPKSTVILKTYHMICKKLSILFDPYIPIALKAVSTLKGWEIHEHFVVLFITTR